MKKSKMIFKDKKKVLSQEIHEFAINDNFFLII